VAKDLFDQDPEWVIFFREILGVDGVIPRLFKSSAELEEFRETEEYAEIQEMVSVLRAQSSRNEQKEPIKIITVRIPASLHESLRAEAHDRRVSMNQLCISKLLQEVEKTDSPRHS